MGHDTHAQCYKWPQPLHNYVKSLFTKRGARGHGVREPDQTILANCPFPTFHSFRVSRLTIYVQITFGDTPMVSNTDQWNYIPQQQ